MREEKRKKLKKIITTCGLVLVFAAATVIVAKNYPQAADVLGFYFKRIRF